MPSLAQRVRKQVLQIDDVMLGESVFEVGREALFVDSRQMAMILEREVSLRLSWPIIREHRARLRSDPRVAIPRSGSDWITVKFDSAKDIPFVVELVALAAAQYRPASDRPLRLPPAGSDLERRRRWH
jgi:hypothetical protein